jgi:aryl-alcohol dehydrogenase-like predicted oxidoreductase
MSGGDYGLSRQQVIKQLDASLRRLRTDYVDLYQCHRYDYQVPLSETMEALTVAVRQGKVRVIGFSEWPPDKIRTALDMPGVERFVSSQPQYSILWRKPEDDIFPLCQSAGISQIVWSPLAQGILTGKYLPNKPVPANARAASPLMGRFFDPVMTSASVLEKVQRLRPIADSVGLTLTQLALAWVLREVNVASAIIGATQPDQIVENVGAVGQCLSPDELVAIDSILEDSKERA